MMQLSTAQHDTFLTPTSDVIAYRYMWEVAGLDQQRLVTSPLTGPFGECDAAKISARAEQQPSAVIEPSEFQLPEMLQFELHPQTHA